MVKNIYSQKVIILHTLNICQPKSLKDWQTFSYIFGKASLFTVDFALMSYCVKFEYVENNQESHILGAGKMKYSFTLTIAWQKHFPQPSCFKVLMKIKLQNHLKQQSKSVEKLFSEAIILPTLNICLGD